MPRVPRSRNPGGPYGPRDFEVLGSLVSGFRMIIGCKIGLTFGTRLIAFTPR